MRKYGNIILNIYIIIKILLTPLVPYVCVLGVYAFTASWVLALDGGLKAQIASILFLISLLWILFLLINLIKIEKIHRIARFGIIALSCLDVLLLFYSLVLYLIDGLNFWHLLWLVFLRLAAIAVNIGCIVFCVKLNSKKVHDNLSSQLSTDSQE